MKSSFAYALAASVAALFCFACPKAAHADEEEISSQPSPEDSGPHRRGFTLELGLGPGYTYVSPKTGADAPFGDAPSRGHFGLSGLSLSLGGYVTPNVALVARLAGTSYWSNDFGHGTEQVVNGVYGGSVVAWVTPSIFVSGGAGVAVLAPAGRSEDARVGFGLDARAGVALLDVKHHALTVGVEVLPAFYSSANVVGTGLDLEWHYF